MNLNHTKQMMSKNIHLLDKMKIKNNIFYVVLFVLMLSAALFIANDVFAGIDYSSTIINLSNDTNINDKFPFVATLDSNVFVAWQNFTNSQIMFSKSVDSGATFGPRNPIATTESVMNEAAINPEQKIAINGANVFVAWQDSNEIKLIRSTDNASTNSTIQTISSTANPDYNVDTLIRLNATSDSSNNYVHLLWVDSSGNARFSASNDNGATFGLSSEFNIGAIVSAEQNDGADMVVSGGKVHTIRTDGSRDIMVRTSTDNGATFNGDVDVGDGSTGFQGTTLAAIAANGPNVYAVWRQSTDIKFAESTDSGATFDTPFDLGNIDSTIAPQIAVDSDGRVHVVWVDGGNIIYRNSTDNGANFFPEDPLSSTGDGLLPKLSVSGKFVHVVWRESTTDDDVKHIRSVTSSNNGESFEGFKDLSSKFGDTFSDYPNIASVDDKSYVVWEQRSVDANSDRVIKLLSGVSTDDSIVYNSTNYRLSEIARITITNTALNNVGSTDTITTATITSTSDGTGITPTFTETSADTGIFIADITFNTSTSSGSSLKVAPGNTIFTTFDGGISRSLIYPTEFTFSSNSYSINSLATLKVTDQNSNTNPLEVEKITVTLSSTNDGETASLQLTEDDVNSGVFGANDITNNKIVLMNGDFNIPLDREFEISQIVTDAVTTPVQDADVLQTFTTKLTSTTDDTTGITINVIETSAASKIYKGTAKLITSTSTGSSLESAVCDVITITPGGSTGNPANYFVSGCADPTIVSLIVSVTDSTSDSIKATLGVVDSVSILVELDVGESGGGGGGLVRPSIVLNAVAAAAILAGGGGSDSSPPIATLDVISKSKSINIPDNIREIIKDQKLSVPIQALEDEPYDLPLAINEKKYPLGNDENRIVTNNIKVGEPIKFKLLFYEQSDLEHVSIYMNLRDGLRSHESDTYVEFNKDKPMNIIDKNGFFENVNFEIIEGEDNKKFAIFEITFAKPMESSDLVYKSWDFNRRGTAVAVYDAIKVEGLPSEEIIETDEVIETVDKKESVPDWIKSNAKWWADDGINDKTFANGIAYLISEQIIDIPIQENISPEKDEDGEIIEKEIVETKIPEWMKTNAKWWADDLMDEETFLSGIEYMVKNDYIIIP